jgi:two-component system NtrC family response regulator
MADNVLIIDDEKKLCGLLARIIGLEGYTVFQAYTGKEGLKTLKEQDIQVVVSDVKLPDYNGIELIKALKAVRPSVEIISLTAYGTIADGVMAMKNGAFDYITKGDDNDKIIPLVFKAMEKAKLNLRVQDLENKISKKHSFESISGNSKAILEAINLAKKVAQTNTTVLLLGETGTGKEVFAQSIHYGSPRNLKSFVAINCSSFNPALLESELFGYVAGAFTGAMKNKKGLLEEADGGTLFLDEIGEMDLDLQAKLLRVLESQTYIKVGATQTNQVNIRIIAATNKDLKKEAENGTFRLDLYYRLSVFTIELPPLSLRKEDILLLAKNFLSEFAAKTNKKYLKMDQEFEKLLVKHPWKGNIRELKNVMERVVILAENDLISSDLLPYEFHNEVSNSDSLNMQIVEKQHILKVLSYAHGNKTEAARLLGIGLTTLYRKIEEYHLGSAT